MKIKPRHVFALALMGSQCAWAADGANANLDSFNSSLAPLFLAPLFFGPFILRTPDRVSITVRQHLQSTVVQTIDAGIDTDAQFNALVEAACTELGLQPGEFDMVTLDTAPASLHTVALVAKADGQQVPTKERVMGICSIVSYLAPGAIPGPGEGGSEPNLWAREYFSQYEKRDLAYPSRADIVVVEKPKHGKVVFGTNSANLELMQYIPDAGYVGTDRIVYSVSVEGKPVKLIYFVHVTKRNLNDVLPTDFCKANTWKISQSDFNSGTQDYAAWLRASELSSLLATASQSFVGFQDLAGSAVGNTAGEGSNATITLDTTAAGHGWYVDSTPLDNTDDYLPTSNPNIWQAKAGTDAAGKMDMLSVLLHSNSSLAP